MKKLTAQFSSLLVVCTLLLTFFGTTAFANAPSVQTSKLHSLPLSGCGVYHEVKSTQAVFNEAGYALTLYLYRDSCSDEYAVAEGFVPQGEPSGGYLCADNGFNNCLVTGGGQHFGSYYDVDSATATPTNGGCGSSDSIAGTFTRLNGSSNISNFIYC